MCVRDVAATSVGCFRRQNVRVDVDVDATTTSRPTKIVCANDLHNCDVGATVNHWTFNFYLIFVIVAK